MYFFTLRSRLFQAVIYFFSEYVVNFMKMYNDFNRIPFFIRVQHF